MNFMSSLVFSLHTAHKTKKDDSKAKLLPKAVNSVSIMFFDQCTHVCMTMYDRLRHQIVAV